MVAVFVDDLLITGTNKAKIAELRAYFRNTFKGQASWDDVINSFLGMEIHYDLVNGILSMQVTAKVKDFFTKHSKLSSVHGINAPWISSFSNIDAPDVELTPIQVYIKDHFSEIAGTFIYLSITCRPDIAPIVNSACKGMHDPQYRHITYLEAAIKYLKNHKDARLVYKRSDSRMDNLPAL